MASRKEIETENEQLKAKVLELTAQLNAAVVTANRPISKGKAQAEAALELLKAGPVTMEQLAGINQKYPNDPIYFVRTLLKQAVDTHRVKGGKTTYSLPVAVVAASEAPAPTEQTPAPEPTEAEVAAVVEQVAEQAQQEAPVASE